MRNKPQKDANRPGAEEGVVGGSTATGTETESVVHELVAVEAKLLAAPFAPVPPERRQVAQLGCRQVRVDRVERMEACETRRRVRGGRPGGGKAFARATTSRMSARQFLGGKDSGKFRVEKTHWSNLS